MHHFVELLFVLNCIEMKRMIETNVYYFIFTLWDVVGVIEILKKKHKLHVPCFN